MTEPMIEPQSSVSRALAEFASATTSERIPAQARVAAVRTITNAASLAVGASRHPAYELVLSTYQGWGYVGAVSLLGRTERLGLTAAPMLTGLAMHVEDFDDTHLPTVVHPGAPVVPAALAVGEHVGASGREVVDAVALGVEVCLRVGIGLGPGHFDRGWHVTGTTGRTGAAVAAGRLLGLDADQMLVALGIAATEAAGLQEALGTMTKAFHAGKAAYDGVEAALLAQLNMTGPEDPIGGRRGLAATVSPAPDVAAMIVGLGERWELETNAFKPYACGIVSHPVIDAAVALRARARAPEGVAAVRVRVNPAVLDVMGIREPTDSLQAKFSVYHCFAVGFLDGAAAPRQFREDRVLDEGVTRLRRLVTVDADATVRRGEAFVAVTTTEGVTFEEHVEHARGSAERAMTDEDLRSKCVSVTAPVLEARAEQFVTTVEDIDDLPSLNPVLDASRA